MHNALTNFIDRGSDNYKRVEYPLQVRAEFLDELEFSESFSPVFSQCGAGD